MKRLLISITILTLLIIPQFTFGSDLDDFKAAAEKLGQAFNSMDTDTIAKMTHPGFIIWEANAPFPKVYPTPDEYKEVLKGWFSTLDLLNSTSINPQYKVVGNTGVVWSIGERVIKRKGGLREVAYSRSTMTFVKSDGKWKLLMFHFSKFPLDAFK